MKDTLKIIRVGKCLGTYYLLTDDLCLYSYFQIDPSDALENTKIH